MPNETKKPKSRKAMAAEAARLLSAMRKTHGGGRPRTEGPRCPCGEMTLRRAEARKHKCKAT